MLKLYIGGTAYNCKRIDGFENFRNYWISESGHVYSTKTNKLLKPDFHKGYAYISLQTPEKRKKRFRIHRLVAAAFLPNSDPANKTYVHHINGNRSDNRVENLLWVTPKENASIRANTIFVQTRNGLVCLNDATRAKLGVAYSQSAYQYAHRLIRKMNFAPEIAIELTAIHYLTNAAANDAFNIDSIQNLIS